MIKRSLVSILVLGLAAAPAWGMRCPTWQGLGPQQKADAIERMIQSAIAGSGGRSYHVNRGAIERCLRGYARDMEYAFDDLCSDPRTAGMNAIRTTFKDYIWSCVE